MKTVLLFGPVLLAAGMMQMPSTPPVKMGLWETTVMMKVTMAGMDMPPHPMKARVCYTADTWAKHIASEQQKGCQRTNESWSPRGYSFDVSCPSMNGTGHVQIDFLSAESVHAVTHIEMSPSGHHAVSDITADSHFVGADCGSVSPDKPVIMP